MSLQHFIQACRSGNDRALYWMAATSTADEWREFLVAAVDLEGLPDATLRFFETHWIERGDVLRRGVEDDTLIIAALRRLTRPYKGKALPVYRGQSRDDWTAGRLGMSWAATQDAASTFGRLHMWNRVGGLVILRADAPPEAIVTIPRGAPGNPYEHVVGEIVVDVAKLPTAPVVVDSIDRPPTELERKIFEAFAKPKRGLWEDET